MICRVSPRVYRRESSAFISSFCSSSGSSRKFDEPRDLIGSSTASSSTVRSQTRVDIDSPSKSGYNRLYLDKWLGNDLVGRQVMSQPETAHPVDQISSADQIPQLSDGSSAIFCGDSNSLLPVVKLSLTAPFTVIRDDLLSLRREFQGRNGTIQVSESSDNSTDCCILDVSALEIAGMPETSFIAQASRAVLVCCHCTIWSASSSCCALRRVDGDHWR